MTLTFYLTANILLKIKKDIAAMLSVIEELNLYL